MADRRKQQNYQAICHYLTDGLWVCLQTCSREKSTNSLMQHAWMLGLRCPTEGTFAIMENLITLSGTDKGAVVSAFQKYARLGDLKKLWKKYKHLRKPDDLQYQEYIEVLPVNPKDLPAEYYLDALSVEQPEECSNLETLTQIFSAQGVRFQWFLIRMILFCFRLCNHQSVSPISLQ